MGEVLYYNKKQGSIVKSAHFNCTLSHLIIDRQVNLLSNIQLQGARLMSYRFQIQSVLLCLIISIPYRTYDLFSLIRFYWSFINVFLTFMCVLLGGHVIGFVGSKTCLKLCLHRQEICDAHCCFSKGLDEFYDPVTLL